MWFKLRLLTLLSQLPRKLQFSEHVNGWHSWDPHPWDHPWLSPANLRNAKAFSQEALEKEKKVLERHSANDFKFGFVGNIANAMYVRAVPLRAAGLDVSILVHPKDDYVMSHPVWEEYDGTLPKNLTSYRAATEEGIRFPEVDGVAQYPLNYTWKSEYKKSDNAFLRSEDLKSYSDYLAFFPTLQALQGMDALWGTQCVYLAYLANRPYVASQSGGDIWFEASRGDLLGKLMRTSFRESRLIAVSNPWTYAHARRFGFNNLVYLPKVLDESVYAPGEGASRNDWKALSGGDFFVLTSSRLDERNKASSITLKGFAAFVRDRPTARLVLIGWGKDKKKETALLESLGIREQVIILPVSGKARIRDYLRSADVFIDQFVLGYFGSAGMEAMACGLPVIGRVEARQYEALSETGVPPILNAKEPGEVRDHLIALFDNADYRKDSANLHRKWFCENHGAKRWFDEYCAVLTSTAVGMPFDDGSSPLRTPLSDEEKAYHRRGLLSAPKFPNYGW